MEREDRPVALVGRDPELATLGAALGAAAAGRPGVVLIGGEAGVGKSALLAEAVARAGDARTLALVGGCVDLAAGSVPFLPIVEALGALPRELGERAWARLVADAPPQLGWLLPGEVALPTPAPPDPLATASARVQVLELVLVLLRRLAAERPVLLAVEDVQWADGSTRDLLSFLARALRDERVALVATFRAEDLDRQSGLRGWLADLGRDPRAARIALAPLGEPDLALHLAAVLGRQPEAALVADVHRRCGGNPFMAQELVGGDSDGGMPETLRDALLARLAALSPDSVEAVRWAAAAGGPVEHRLLAAVLGRDEGELTASLREAVRGAVLVPERGTGRWAFRHELLRETAYDELLPGEREARHRALALALESDPALAGSREAAAAAVAGHWMAARDPARALGAAVRAAEVAERVRAYREAHALLERALTLWDEVPDPEGAAGESREEVVARAAEAAALANDVDRALALTADADVAERLRPLRGWWLMLAGRADEALAAYEAAQRTLPPEGSPERAWTLALHALATMLAGRTEGVQELAERAQVAASAAGVPAAASLAQTAWCAVRTHDGDPAAIAELEEALALAREVGAAEAEAVALTNLTHALGRAGRLRDSVALALDGADRCRRLGLERGYGLFLEGNACEMLVVLGRFDEAEQLVDRGLDLAPEGLTAVHLHTQRGAIALERGDPDGALDALTHAVRLGGGAGAGFAAGLEALRAEALAEAGRPIEAAGAARAALEAALASDDTTAATAAVRCGVRVAADRAQAARARHDVRGEAAARADGEALWEGLMAAGAGRSPLALAELATARAEHSRLGGESAPEAWEEAAAAWRALSAPARAASAELRRAEALLRAGAPRAEVAGALETAHRSAQELGAAGIVRETVRVAARARVALARPEPGAGPAAPALPAAAADLGVTPRELEVLALVAAGRTNRQIADELVISVKTAGIHVSNILRKLSVGNRSEAGAVALRAGLVDEETLDRLLG